MEIISSILFFVEKKKRHISTVFYGFFLGMLPQQWPFPDDMKHSKKAHGIYVKACFTGGVSHLKFWSPALQPQKQRLYMFLYIYIYIHTYFCMFVCLYTCICLLHTQISHKWLRHALHPAKSCQLNINPLTDPYVFTTRIPYTKPLCPADISINKNKKLQYLPAHVQQTCHSRCYEVNPSNLTPVFKLDLDIDEVSLKHHPGQLVWP